MTLQTKKILWFCLLTLLAATVGSSLHEFPPFQAYEEDILDVFFRRRLKPLDQKAPEVALVLIDENALEARYGYQDPTPRRYIAALIDSLARKNPRTIALDLAFPDRLTRLDPAGDSVLVDAMQRAGNVLAVSILYATDDSLGIAYQPPHAFFQNALQATGYANLQVSVSKSGFMTIRGVRPIWPLPDGQTPLSFSAAVYCHYKGIKPADFIGEIEQLRWPIQPDGRMLINFTGPPAVWIKRHSGAWKQIREGQIVTFRSSLLTSPARLPDEIFKDKVVFIATGSEFAKDQFVTPYYHEKFDYQLMRGAELHANSFLNLLNDDALHTLDVKLVAAIMLLLAGLVIGSTWLFGFWGELAALFILLAGVWWGGYAAFVRAQLWLPVGAMSVTLLLSYLAASVYMAFTEERKRKELKRMFQRYAPPAYVDELIRDPSKLELGGEEKEISILFSDIEGFTTISEQLEPKTLITLLNQYLNAMTKSIFDQNGTLDKYIGDAIVAVFGAPLPQEDHALKACYTAIAMQKTLAKCRPEWQSAGYPAVRSRIGLNTGTVVFGNIGSEIRYDYTGIGDAVNLAARLESANKTYGTYIMLSEFTYERVRDFVHVRELDYIAVKGKTKPVRIFELLGRSDEPLPPPVTEWLAVYQEALQYYHQRHFSMAITKFEKTLKLNPTDGPSKLYAQRCRDFMQTPPPADWDGVYHMTSK